MKCGSRRLAAIVPKDEFVEVNLELGFAHTVVGADEPLLQSEAIWSIEYFGRDTGFSILLGPPVLRGFPEPKSALSLPLSTGRSLLSNPILNSNVSSGDLLEVEHGRPVVGRAFTTPEMQTLERNNIAAMLAGQGQVTPLSRGQVVSMDASKGVVCTFQPWKRSG